MSVDFILLGKRPAENTSVRNYAENLCIYRSLTLGWITGFLQGAYFEGLDIGQIVADCVNSASPCADLEHFVQVTNAYPYEIS